MINPTALIPHSMDVLPILTTAEPSDVEIEPTLTMTGRNFNNSLPSGLTSFAK